MSLIVDHMIEPPPGERLVEVVERKGLGHPDTICDALAEEVSRALSRHYLGRFGQVLHHNVDKALLCGGSASPQFGGGAVTEPIEIILAGRVATSFRGVDVPAEALAIEACRAWLHAHLRALDPERHVRIECRFRPGSAELVGLFGRGKVPLANDTSIGVGFAPLSPLEGAVLDVERWINAPQTKRERPESGEDVKVMGVRQRNRAYLTVACAFVSAHVDSLPDYLDKKHRLAEAIVRSAGPRMSGPVEVVLNAADDPTSGSAYLTVTGTSAEAGDDGQVGRGNRVNGLITPGRAMTLEAAAGKNPVSHVGKLYNIVAGEVANAIIAALPDVTAVECVLVSRIGAPIDEPGLVSIRARTRDGRPVLEYADAAGEIAKDHLRRVGTLATRLMAGEIGVY